MFPLQMFTAFPGKGSPILKNPENPAECVKLLKMQNMVDAISCLGTATIYNESNI